MTVVVSSVSREDAERFAERIRLDLEGAADRIEAAKLKIRTALTERHDVALGYVSPGAYLADRFSDALSRLGVDSRREFVAELDAAGLSTRAIAAVTGTSVGTAHNDRQVFRAEHLQPEPSVDTETGEVSDDYPAPESWAGTGSGGAAVTPPTAGRVETPTPRPAVTGLDGKTYTRPEPRAPKRRALTDQFFEAAYDMGKAVEKVARLTEDDRFTQNAEKVAAKHRNDLLRARDLLQQVIDSLPKEEDSNA